jgi:hypothetical protein
VISEQLGLGTISAQLDLGWHDAWKHERRAPDGRWIKGGAVTADVLEDANINDAISREWRMAKQNMAPKVQQRLNRASAAWAAGDRGSALAEVQAAADEYKKIGGYGHAARVEGLADRISRAVGPVEHIAPGMDPEAVRQLTEKVTRHLDGEIVLVDNSDATEDTFTYLSLARNVMSRAQSGTNWSSVAAGYIRKAADTARVHGDENRAERLDQLAHDMIMIPPDNIPDDTPQAKATQFLRDAAPQVPKILGGGHLAWDGRPVTLDDFMTDIPGYRITLAQIDWDGHVQMKPSYAEGMTDALANPDKPISNPDWFTVPLHELIHADIPDDEPNRRLNGDDDAFQERAYADIEEGFTELGNIQHAPEFFDAMGVGKRATDAVSGKDNPAFSRTVRSLSSDLQKQWAKMSGDQRAPYQQAARHLGVIIEDLKGNPGTVFEDDTVSALQEVQHLGDPELSRWAIGMIARVVDARNVPTSKPLTMHEYAAAMQDPARINNGDAWGHYPDLTTWAEQWVEMITKSEGHRIGKHGSAGWRRMVELTDQINREGTKRKPDVMATQLYTVLMKESGAREDPAIRAELMKQTKQTVLRSWAYGISPVDTALKESRARMANLRAAAA